MTRTFRTLTLGLAAAAAFVATPALAQKGGPTPVTEVDKAARSAVHITYACDEVQVCHEYDWNHLELPVTRRDNGPFAGYYYDFYVHAVRVYSDSTPNIFFSKNYSEGRVSLTGYLVKK